MADLSFGGHSEWVGASLKLGSTGKRLKSRAPLRYASSCSGVDSFAQALQRVYGVGGWQYVAACERDARSRRILAQVYGGDGLREEAIPARLRMWLKRVGSFVRLAGSGPVGVHPAV